MSDDGKVFVPGSAAVTDHEKRCRELGVCPICDAEMEYECCWYCMGDGGFHDCGEDCCPCAEQDPNEICTECGGSGKLPVCPNAGRHDATTGFYEGPRE